MTNVRGTKSLKGMRVRDAWFVNWYTRHEPRRDSILKPITWSCQRFQMEERGESLAFMTLMLLVLMGFAGLALDGGNAYFQRQRVQIAADAAALAGARAIALDQGIALVGDDIQTIATTNGADSVAWNYIEDGDGVHVEAQRTFPTWFAHLFGQPTITVRAEAEALSFAVTSAGNLLPMTTMCTDFTYNTVYRLWDNNLDAPGAFGWLDWDGPGGGNNQLADNIASPSNSGVWNIGDLIPAGPGVQNSEPVKAALDLWIDRPVTIPLYSEVTGQGANTRYEICGFAQFTLTAYNFHGSNKWVEGTFIRTVDPSEVFSTGGPDFGVRDVRLSH